jgi:hydrogenase maturation protease
MERLVGYQRAVVVDAVHTGRAPVGTVRRLPLETLVDPSAGHTTSAHDVSLATALAAGRALGADLPDQVTLVAVEIAPCREFSETLSPEVEAAVPLAAGLALRTVLEVEHRPSRLP